MFSYCSPKDRRKQSRAIEELDLHCYCATMSETPYEYFTNTRRYETSVSPPVPKRPKMATRLESIT
jgi:hypothetical protein